MPCRRRSSERFVNGASSAPAGRSRRGYWRIVVDEAHRVAREPRGVGLDELEERSANGRADDPLGIRSWIAALPGRQRDAVFLRYYADLDYRAIAYVLGVEVGTVSATLAAAHRSLRKKLEEVRQ